MDQTVLKFVFESSPEASWGDPVFVGPLLLAAVAILNTLFLDWLIRRRESARHKRERRVVIEVLAQELSLLVTEAVGAHSTIEELSESENEFDQATFIDIAYSKDPDMLGLAEPELVNSPKEWYKHLDVAMTRNLGHVRRALHDWRSIRTIAGDPDMNSSPRQMAEDLLDSLDAVIKTANKAIEELEQE